MHNASLLFRNGPVRAWSDGAQLASETALAQIGMAPLGLFPVAYLAPKIKISLDALESRPLC